MEKNIKHQDELLRTVMHKVAEDTERMSLSDDFADRLVQRIRQEEATKRNRMQHKRIWLSVGIAAVILLLLVMGFWLNGKFNEKPELVAKTDTIKTAPQTETKKVEEQPLKPVEQDESADTVTKVKEIQRITRPQKTYMAKLSPMKEEKAQPKQKNALPDTILYASSPYYIASEEESEPTIIDTRKPLEGEVAIEYAGYSIWIADEQRFHSTYEDVEREIRERGERMTKSIELAMGDELY